MRFDDFARATRSQTVPEPTDRTEAILAAARELLVGARPLIEVEGLTLVGLTLTNLSDNGAIQLALPVEEARAHALDTALDDVRDRFGSASITRAVLVGRDPGLSVPLLPD
jgi:DNA polymerase-4